jgi:hypothetical protein
MSSPPESDGADPTRSKPALKAKQRAGIAIAAALLLGFAVLVALHLHGFSLAAWHVVIDGSAPTEILLGEPRLIRSDDWKMQLPILISQTAVSPAFPVVNPSIGLGQSMLLPVETPTNNWITLFRPAMWGFFLGPDAGLAWLWWSRVLGLFGVWLAVLVVVTRGRLVVAAAGSALLVCSPFFQFWSLNAAPQAISMGAAFLATVALARARSARGIAASALALAVSGAWFALSIYPPYQVALGWLYLALVAGFVLDQRDLLPLRSQIVLRAVALAAACVAVVALVALFANEASDAITAMRNTVSPGRRVSTGAERNLAELWNANLGAPLWADDWGPLLNICEAASFWMLSPVPLALLLWRRVRGARLDALTTAVAIYAGAMLFYAVVGVPEWLARVTALGFVPGQRAVIGIGIADVILLARLAATSGPARRGERGAVVVIAATWGIALAAGAWWLARELPEARLVLLAAFVAANVALAFAFLRWPRRTLPVLAVLSAFSTLWFNPLARGGSAYLRDNALARKVVEIDRAAGGDTAWVSFGQDDLANLLRANGVRALNGAQPIPQLELWKRIDPRQLQQQVYNRYAHVAFVAAPVTTPRFLLRTQDLVVVKINPDSRAFRALGVTHVLVRDEIAEPFEKFSGFEPIGVVGTIHLFRVPR